MLSVVSELKMKYKEVEGPLEQKTFKSRRNEILTWTDAFWGRTLNPLK